MKTTKNRTIGGGGWLRGIQENSPGRSTVFLGIRVGALAALTLGLSGPVMAAVDQRMVDHFSAQIAEFENAIQDSAQAPDVDSVIGNESPRSVDRSMSGRPEFYFRNFFVKTRVTAAFEIPGIMKLAIVPETEFLWQRDWPAGYVSYRPAHPARP